ncbi:MAG: 2-phospho-L-lactate transferase CofD family protein [Solirubrobacterales bacterium]
MVVALLAGGTGGAKLAAGLRDILHGTDGFPAIEPGELHVIANTGDDIEIYHSYVSPDPDLITFRLAGVLNDAGFGIEGESHDEMNRRRAAGEEIWFQLGDDDLTVCRERAELLAAGSSLTEAHRKATAAYDTGGARVLPMSDAPVRTVVVTPDGERRLQEYLIRDRSEPAIESVRVTPDAGPAPTAPAVLEALERADLVVIGPSNPVISIDPILKTAGLLEAIDAPLIAVSPFVGGEVLKGPTAKFLTAAGAAPNPQGALDFLQAATGGAIDGFVGDEPVTGIAHHLTDVRMSDTDEQRKVAAEVIRYGRSFQ